MPRVLLTGASGFLGAHMLETAIGAGWDVLALVHSRPLSLRQSHAALPVVSVQEASSRGWTAILAEEQINAVYHLAAFIPADHSDPTLAERCFQVNALLTLDLLRASVRAGVRRFVYFSAGSAYVPGLDRPAKETDPLYPALRSPFYLGSKVLGELFVEHFRCRYELSSICLRISSPYGVGMPSKSMVARFMTSAGQGLPLEVWEGGRYSVDLVYVEDVVSLAASALTAGAPGVYNVGSGVATSSLELAQTIARVFSDRHVQIIVSPPGSNADLGFCALDISRAQATWGYSPRSLEDGLSAFRLSQEQAR